MAKRKARRVTAVTQVEQALRLSVEVRGDRVVLRMDHPVTWVSLRPEMALDLAATLRAQATVAAQDRAQ